MANTIDDIFAQATSAKSKGKRKQTDESSAAGAISTNQTAEPKKKKKKRSVEDEVGSVSKDHEDEQVRAKKKKKHSNTSRKGEVVPETVLDPSAAISQVKAPPASESSKSSSSRRPKGRLYQADDEDIAFMDSRGSTRKRTEEGFPIYTEAELKLGQGGDTPLCPFDCDCCF